MSTPKHRAAPPPELEPGPIEAHALPDRLVARVVEPGPAPRIRGFDVQGDLAVHYGFAELALVAATGHVPTRAEGRALEIALCFLAPLPVCEAPTHVAVLSRLCGGPPQATLAACCTALAEAAAFDVRAHRPLLAWLQGGPGPCPPGFGAVDDSERQAVGRLRAALGPTGLDLPSGLEDPSLLAAILSVLVRCGVADDAALTVLLVLARLPCAAAEGLAAPSLGFREYPLDLPPFRYVEDLPDEVAP